MRFALLFCCTVLPLSLHADDWPELMGPKRRGISAETGWNMDWNRKEPPVLWRAQVGLGASSCAVAGGRLYTTGASREGTEYVMCLNAATGKEIWRQTYECKFDERMWDGGVAATPVFDGGRVYSLSFRGQLFCWNAADGKKIWEAHLERDFKGLRPRWGWAGSPLVAGNMVIVEPGGNGSSVAALDKLTGKVFWQSGTWPASYGSPILFSNSRIKGVALFNARGLCAIDPRNGRQLFQFPWKTPNDVNAAVPIHKDGRFFIGSGYGKGLGLIDVTSGSPRLVWENEEAQLQFQSGVLINDHLFLVSGDNNHRAELMCLEFATGRKKWSSQTGRKNGHTIAAGGKLIVATDSGEIILAEPDTTAFKELGRIDAVPQKVWACPAFSDQRLFVRNNAGTIVCLDLRP